MCSEIHEGYMNTITRLKDSIKTTVLCSSIGKSPDHDVLTVSYTPKGEKKERELHIQSVVNKEETIGQILVPLNFFNAVSFTKVPIMITSIYMNFIYFPM
jgi:hypothetical protein